MPRYDHLKLVRLAEPLERRKRPGFGSTPPRDFRVHGAKLKSQIEAVVDAKRSLVRSGVIDPSLLLRVKLSGGILESEWEQLGLTVVASDDDRTFLLFSTNDELEEFRRRIDAYSEGTRSDRRQPAYGSFVGNVDSVASVAPEDRIGLRFREEGFSGIEDFGDNREFLVDVELWEIGGKTVRERELSRISDLVERSGGEVFDRYVGPSITMLRARVTSETLSLLLEVNTVASVDLPPALDLITDEILDIGLETLPEITEVSADAPVIGVIDSGLNEHPALTGIVVGSVGIPAALGMADDCGHGTRVAGVAAFGDLRTQITRGSLAPSARVASAKVVNAQGRFDDKRLVPSQMREAITKLRDQYGCRIFVISLAENGRVYKGGKVGVWAATLDELARELDVVIVVSAGNRLPRAGADLEEAITHYPAYLLEDANSIFEPGGAMNVLTVGSIAHGPGLGPTASHDVHLRAITGEREPSPFTRVGPGMNRTLKPDLVDLGGTMVFDAVSATLRVGANLPSAGMLSLNHKFFERLFTSASGTSYSAPLVAHKAAQVLSTIPGASANLVRALLVGAAAVPDEATARLAPLGEDAISRVCGHGQVDPLRAAYSDDNRVIFVGEDSLAYDHFAVYQIPVPQPFQGGGRRRLRVTLAFDPPVRNSRVDYTGVRMNYRVLRGCSLETVFEFFRRRTRAEGPQPEIPDRFACDLKPGPQARDSATVQRSSVTFSRDTSVYGDVYYLVVRCEGGWAAAQEIRQKFALVVELLHEGQVQLYERLAARIRV